MMEKRMSTSLSESLKKFPVNYSLANASKSDVTYRLFTNTLPNGIHLTENNIHEANINKDLPTKILIHGWNANIKSLWYEACRKEYFKHGEYNVIDVNWVIPANKEMPISSANVKPVGNFIADFIVFAKLNVHTIHILAKSLGCHVASWTGKKIQELTCKKLSRITGLDPSSPQFENEHVPAKDRLNKTDAAFVDIVHTDSGYYGFVSEMGTVDFYPNGGDLQPGCSSDDHGHSESHERSLWYFLESINSATTEAWKSQSWDDFQQGNFNKDESIIFGEDTPHTAHGVYYFKTNPEMPYLCNTSTS